MDPEAIVAGVPVWAAGGHWLMTSASAKVDLANRLRNALNRVGLKLVATDVSAYAPALYAADEAFLGLPSDSPGFLEHLIEQCHRRSVRVIVPTRDAELPLLAGWSGRLSEAGIWVMVSPLSSVLCCQDKLSFHAWCREHGLPVLPSLNVMREREFPVFVRPRYGAGGQGSGRVDSWDALKRLTADAPKDWLIQPFRDLPEYTIDALFDFEGKPVQWVARERLQVVAGESKVSRTVAEPALDGLVMAMGKQLPLYGPVTLQAFFSPEDGPWLIEINPRFGGACALGIEAGLATPERLVALVQGDPESFERERQIRTGLTMLRYSTDRFLDSEALQRLAGGRAPNDVE